MQGRLAGWKSIKKKLLDFYKCPGCGGAQESLFYSSDEMCECFKCNRKFPKDSFGSAMVKRTVVECGHCGSEVSITPSHANMFGIGYMCSQCQKFVAVEYGPQILDPVELLKQTWNPAVEKNSIVVDNDSAFFKCRTKKDYLIVQILQVLAKEEEKSFMSVRKGGGQSAGLYFDASKRKLVGFLTWNKYEGHAVLRQLFIVSDERRRGLAARLVIFWVKEYADKISDTFGIEAPNEKALSLHAKLGHIKVEGDTAFPLKAFFAPTF